MAVTQEEGPNQPVKQGESTNQGQKKSSPYDLNSNDNPGSVITQVQLRGENYDEWA